MLVHATALLRVSPVLVLTAICACGGGGGGGPEATAPTAQADDGSPSGGPSEGPGSSDAPGSGSPAEGPSGDCGDLRTEKLEECTQIAQCDTSDPDCDPSLIPEMKETCAALADVELLVCKCQQGNDQACDDLEAGL